MGKRRRSHSRGWRSFAARDRESGCGFTVRPALPNRGSRHHAALALHGVLLRAKWTEEESACFVGAIALSAGDEEWSARAADASTTARRLAEKGTATGRPHLTEILDTEVADRAFAWLGLGRGDTAIECEGFSHTDLGNAKRFALAHRENIRFCHRWKKWLTWDGYRWVHDEVGKIQETAKQTAIGILLEAADEHDDEKRKKLLAWQKQSEFDIAYER